MYKVEISSKTGYVFKVESGKHSFIVDMNKEAGLTPPDVLLASLGTCVGVYIRKYAQGSKLELGEFQVSIEAEFSKETPVCFKEIKVIVNLNGTVLDERRINALKEFVKNCPVHNTLKSEPQVDIQIS